jgi:thioredoxin 1
MLTTFIILGLLFIVIGALVIRAYLRMKNIRHVKDSERVVLLDKTNFQHRTRAGWVLVDFWAAWCTPCKLMVPVLNDLSEEFSGKVTIAKLNIDESPAIASKFNVKSIPTMILFKNGKPVDRFTGVKTRDYLSKQLERRVNYLYFRS